MINPLTSLRFFFALMVFTFHLNVIIIKSESNVLKWLYNNIFEEGFIGVSFFFILSGFILAYNYQSGFIDKTRTKRSFFIARFARIYPLHFLCFLIFIPYAIFSSPLNTAPFLIWVRDIAFNLTLTQSFTLIPSIILSFNAPSWSISNEMFFYLCFPFLIPLIIRVIRNKYKYVLFIAFLLVVPILINLLPERIYNDLFYFNPVIRIFDFILGILVFNLYKKTKDHKVIASLNFTHLELLVIGFLVLFIAFHSYIPKVYRFAVYYWLPMSLLILVFAFQKGYVSKTLSNKRLVLLGEISFGFYMIHMMVLMYSVSNFYLTSFEPLKNIYVTITLIIFIFSLTLLLSYISFLKFETPMNKYIKKRFR